MAEEKRPDCPHCGSKLEKWQTPPLSTWESEFQWVCFNDECPYFQRGWDWMMANQNVKASYRHSVNPRTGKSSPLPVWSYVAHKEHIVEE